MMVFSGHTILSFGSPSLLAPLQFGGTGVDLFFVLSGWLIGRQLFKEQSRFGNIQLYRFWIRRWMRTLPAYYAVLTLTIIQQYINKPDFDFPWQHLLFLQNYKPDLSLFYVSWSLSVEEQFYLLIAPFALLLFKLPSRSHILLLIVLLLTPSLFRYLDLYNELRETHVRIDCCAMGVLLAYIRQSKPRLWDILTRSAIKLMIPAVVIYLMAFVSRYNPQWGISDPSKLVLAVIFGIWVIWSETTNIRPNTWFMKVLMHISTRSYAMYLLHVDALAVTHKFLSGQHFILYYFTALCITMISSEVLYRMVELPVMNIRKYFSWSQSRQAPKTENRVGPDTTMNGS
jgi:peptidoglycan/LPS O-acetylase OafA/YrhL